MRVDLNLLAKIVANNMNTRVVAGKNFKIGKDQDGLVITMPPLADGSEDEAANLRAGLCHEAVGHGRFTDFEAKRGATPLHLSIENVLEDARIEKCAWKVYPGARRILHEGMVVLVKQNKIRRSKTEDSPAEKAAIAILLRLMVEELSYSCGIDWKEDWAIAVSFFGDEVLEKAWRLAVAGYQTESTGDVVAYAAKIVDLLKAAPPPEQKPQEQNGQQQDEQSNQSSEKGSEGDSNDQSKDGEPSSGKGSEGDSDSNGEPSDGDPSQGGSRGDSKDEQSGQSSGGYTDGESSAEQPGGQGSQSSGSGIGGQPAQSRDLGSINPEEFDRGNVLSESINDMRQTVTDSEQINIRVLDKSHENLFRFSESADAKTASQRLKSRLMQKLISMVEDEDDELADRGSLSGTHLVSAVLGDRDVFTEPGEPGEGLDIAISFLIDMSGSMAKESRGMDCLSATWAINNVLNGYSTQGVRFSISSFNSMLHLLKDWGSPWKQGNCLVNYTPKGSTRTVIAARNRLEDLIRVRSHRKVLFLITDGDIGPLDPVAVAAKEMNVELVVMMIGASTDRLIVEQAYLNLKAQLPSVKRISVVPEGQVASAAVKGVLDLF